MVRKRTLNLELSLERFLQAALLALLASGYIALAFAGALDLAGLLGGAAALVARFAQLTGLMVFTIPERWANLATICYLLFVPADYLLLSRDPLRTTVHLIVFVAAIKVLSARTPRDNAIVGLIAFLEMLAAAVTSSSLTFLLLLMVFWAAALAALASAEIRGAMRGRASVAGTAGISGRLGLLTLVSGVGVLALTVTLFLVLPRTARFAMERLMPRAQRVTGFAAEITLGQPGEIQRNSTPMLHVHFEGSEPPARLHWRGTALAEFDGRRWYNSPGGGEVLRSGKSGYVQLVSDDQRWRRGARSGYEVVLNGPSEYLFFAGLPEVVHVNSEMLVRTPSGGVKLPFGGSSGLHYVFYTYFGGGAALDESPPANLSPHERTFHLRLPPVDGRTIALARSITAGAPDDAARARSLEQYLRTHFAYSLEAEESASLDPLGEFLFERREGHCEYFASAMAVMLRALWIPSRVATGYLGGTANPLTGWVVIRASDAHAWVEAWIPGQGWTTYDPTPSGPGWDGAGLWARLGMYLDAAETFWQEWVVGYDQDRQLTLAFQTRRFSAPWFDWDSRRFTALWKRAIASRWPHEWTPLTIAAAAILMLSLALVFRRWIVAILSGRRPLDALSERANAVHEAARLYRSMLAAMHKRGVDKEPFQTAGEFAAGVCKEEAAPLIAEFTAAYHALRYEQQTEQAERMTLLLRRIEALPR